jgi:hypothetical protein
MWHLYALTISDQIGVAGITTIGLVIVTMIQNQSLRRKASKAADKAEEAKTAAELTALHADEKTEELKQVVHESVGQANGNGTVVEMLERIDERTKSTQQRQSGLADRVTAVHELVTSLNSVLKEHIKRYDHEHPHDYVDPPKRGRPRPLT